MPFFKVTLPPPEGQSESPAPTYHQAHDRAMIRAALVAQGHERAKIEAVRTCVECLHAAATATKNLCQPCYDDVIARGREVLKDEPISDREKDELTLSFYVDA